MNPPEGNGTGPHTIHRHVYLLDQALRRQGIQTRTDDRAGHVDAATPGVASPHSWSAVRALLRPHRGDVWWWLMLPSPPPLPRTARPVPTLVPVAPAHVVERVVGRIQGVLGLADH